MSSSEQVRESIKNVFDDLPQHSPKEVVQTLIRAADVRIERIVDLAGRALLPGFVDGHGHCFGTGLQAASANLLAPPDYTITDIPGIIAELKKYAKSETAMKYGLILGFGYDEAQLKEQRPPNRHELDEVSKDIPVYIIHQSTHLGAGNTKALEIAGITAETKNPVGGVIRREKDGKTPDGVLEETIHYASLMKIMPKMGQAEFDGLAKAGMKLYAANGYRDSSNDVEFVSHKYRTPKYAVGITFYFTSSSGINGRL